MGVRVSKADGATIIRILQDDVKRFSSLKALVLIDGVPIEDHDAVLDYNARLLHYIHQYSGRYTFGGKLYDGIISMITHRGTLPGLRLDENSQLFAYEFPQTVLILQLRYMTRKSNCIHVFPISATRFIGIRILRLQRILSVSTHRI